MPKQITIPSLTIQATESDEVDPMLIEFDPNWQGAEQLWRTILGMAVRDSATSLHYDTWWHSLFYIVNWVKYELCPIHQDMSPLMMTVAGEMMCESPFGCLIRRRWGWPIRSSGRVTLVGESGTSEWAGAVWPIGDAWAVEWLRLDAVPPPRAPRESGPPGAPVEG